MACTVGAVPHRPRSLPPNRPLCAKPKMRCGCVMRTARSAGKTTCRARSSWKTDSPAATAGRYPLRRRSVEPPRPCARAAAARLGAVWQLPLALGAVWLVGLAGPDAGRRGALPGDRQLVALAESFDVSGDDALDPLQAFLVRGFG